MIGQGWFITAVASRSVNAVTCWPFMLCQLTSPLPQWRLGYGKPLPFNGHDIVNYEVLVAQ